VQRIYLDYNATSPLDPVVREHVADAMLRTFGNPSSVHWFGQQARAAIEQARAEVAALIGASAGEIVFTASGTEADNMALRGIAAASPPQRRQILYSAVEHHAVMRCAQRLASEGWLCEAIRVDGHGRIDLDDLRAHLSERTCLVSLMLANNETGVIQPVAQAAQLAHDHGALVLCDAVQAVGKIPVRVEALGVDVLALSAHKLYGPKGVGALFVRRNTRMEALIRGGAQERNRRAGTENVPGIVGLGSAAEIAALGLESEGRRQAALRDELETELLKLPATERNGDEPRVPNTTNVSFGGVEAESLVMALDLAGIAVSTGAACAQGAVEPSHVLRAMGLPPARVQASLRFSLGRGTTPAEIRETATRVAELVRRATGRG
jgi:cysteine desulfurase